MNCYMIIAYDFYYSLIRRAECSLKKLFKHNEMMTQQGVGLS